MDPLGILLVILLVIALLTVVGHGIWVAVAWLVRGGRSKRDRAGYEPTLSDDRAATARYLGHLRTRGWIDEATHGGLVRLIAKESRPGRTPQPPLAPKDELAGEAEEASAGTVPPRQPVPVAVAPEHRGAQVKSATPAIRPTPAEPKPPPARRRAVGDVLVSFMAEKNIRWGELTGGLLILCCSTALVISLWSQIEAIPVLKFLIFTAVTAALFGAGLFVHHRWSLPTTGHALLVISTLLVPLNLLAFAAFSRPRTLGGWTVAAELPAVALFGWLTLLAGRVVMANAPKLLACGVMGLSFSSLVIRFAWPRSEAAILATSLLPLGAYLTVMGVSLWRQSRIRSAGEEEAKRLILQLGVQTFACLAPLSLLFYESGSAVGGVQLLAPLLCAVAAPALATGLLLWHRLAETVSSHLRTVAASIANVAAAAMLLGVGLAWPIPSRLMVAILVNALSAVALGRLTRHKGVHAVAAVWLAAAWVLGVQLAFGGVAWSETAATKVVAAVFSAATGRAMVAPVAVCLFAAAWFDRRKQRTLSAIYFWICLTFWFISVALVTAFGFRVAGDAEHVTWVYAVYAVGAFAVAGRLRQVPAVWCGGILAQVAIAQVLVYTWPLQSLAWPTALLIGASLCTAAAAALRRSGLRREIAELYGGPLTRLALLISVPAAAWLAIRLSSGSLAVVAVRMAWLAVLWLVLSFLNRWTLVFAGSQFALVVAGYAAVQDRLGGLPWYQASLRPLHDPWVWQAHLLAAGGLCLLWATARIVLRRRAGTVFVGEDANAQRASGRRSWPDVARALLCPSFPAADRWLTAAVVAGLVVLCLWSAWPGAGAEHGSHSFFLPIAQHAHAAGLGSWLLLAVAAAAMILYLAEDCHGSAFLGVLVTAACGIALLAARFEPQQQVVSAWRWLSAGVFLIASAAAWTKGLWLDRVLRVADVRPGRDAVGVESVPLLFCLMLAFPALLLTATFGAAAASGVAVGSSMAPDPWLRFLLIGPLLLVWAALIGHGVWLRSPGYAAATTVLAVATVIGVELCVLSRAGLGVSSPFAVRLVQIGALVSAGVAAAWRAAQVWGDRPGGPMGCPRWPLLACRAAIGVVLILVAAALWIRPQVVPAAMVTAGTAWGLLAAVLVEWALRTTCRSPSGLSTERPIDIWVVLGVVLGVCALARFDTGNWLCFHALMIGFVAAGGLRLCLGDRQVRRLVGAGWQETFDTASARASGAAGQIEHDLSCAGCGYNLRSLAPWGRCPECNAAVAQSLEAAVGRLTPQWTAQLARTRMETSAATVACAALGTLLAMRAVLDDPQRPWWSAAVLVAMGGLCIALAGWTPRRAFAYVGGLEVCLAASVWWVIQHWQSATPSFEANLSNLLHVNVIGLGVAGAAWLLVERMVLWRRLAAADAGRWPAFHHAAAVVSATVVTVLAGGALYGGAIRQPLGDSTLASWPAWCVATALMIACGARPAFRHVPAGLYVLGLAAAAAILAHAGLSPLGLAWVMCLVLAGYVLITTSVWRWWRKSHRESSVPFEVASWLPTVNGILTSVSLVLAVYVSFTHPDTGVRMLVVLSPLLCSVAAALAAGRDPGGIVRTCSLALLAAGGVLLAWSWVPPDASAVALHRAVGVLAAISVLTAVSGVTAMRLDARGAWATAMARTVGGSFAVAGFALLYCLGFEIDALANGQPVPLRGVATAVVIVALVLLIAEFIVFAVRERLDPLCLNAGMKEGYVYAAECLAAAIALHVRATMPWLFSGVITQYWPLLVLAIAVAAIGAGEASRRRGLHVLARPLNATGTYLPLVALLELFIARSVVDYSIVLLMEGSLYAVLAALRRSVAAGGMAGLLLNGSLWHLLHHTPGLGMTEHPQLWIIPPALAVLVAGHMTRDRLREPQRVTLHYACLLAVYLSSTADIFLIGVERAPWLSMVLAVLSVAGIFVGLGFRVRSCLLLGTGFLCLSLLTMIWHAAENLGWTWMWYVAGIALGAGIITVFALFEKKRSQMKAWLEGLRQ